MPVYTVENQQGRIVKFDWRGEVEPTEDDVDEIFGGVIGKPTMYESEIPPDIGNFQKVRNVLEAPGKGVLNFIASSPQWIGGLIKEHGERAEETPDFWDWALTPQMAVGKAMRAYQAERTNTDEKIASFGDTIIKRNLDFIKDKPVLQPEEGKLNEFMFSLGSGAGSLAGAIGLSLLTKSPHVAAMAFGAMAKGTTYQRAREAGKSERAAGRLSTAHGFGEAALESLGLRLIFGKYAGRLIPSMITEGIQEMSQEIWGNVVAKVGIDKAQKIMENVGMSGLIGFILGGGAGIVTGAVRNTESGQMLAESGADIGKIVTRMEETLLPQLQEIMESESGQVLIDPEGEGVTDLQDAHNRGLRFEDLSSEQQEVAKAKYQKETGDLAEEEKGWEQFGYHPETLKVLGDDPVYTEQAKVAKLGRFSGERAKEVTGVPTEKITTKGGIVTDKDLPVDMGKADWKQAYEEGLPHWAKSKEPSPLAKRLLDVLPAKTNNKILEIGVGNGRDSIFLGQKGNQVTGIDIAEGALKLAKENAQAKKVGDVAFEVGNAEKLKYADEEFDAVYSISVLHSTILPDSLKEVSRVLKPNGKALIYLYEWTKQQDKTYKFYSDKQVREIAKKNNLEVEHLDTKTQKEGKGIEHKILIYEMKKVATTPAKAAAKPEPAIEKPPIAKPEVEVTPEEIEESTRLMEAEAIAEISHEIELDPSSNLFRAIKDVGGVKFYEGMVMKEEMQGIPAYLFDKEGLPPDELRDSLKQFGWKFESEGEMLESIRTIAQEKGITVVSGMPKVRKDVKAIASQLKAMSKAHNVKVKDLLARVRKLGKELEKPLAKGKVKPLVRVVTGQEKEAAETIAVSTTELISIEATGAKIATRATKQSIKESQAEAVAYVKAFVPLKERGKLLVSVRDATDAKALSKALLMADSLAVKSGRRSAINFLKTEIKNVKAVIKRGRVKGKATIAWEAQDRLRIIIDGLTSFKPGGRRQQATELAAKFYHDHPNEAMPAELKSRISDLSKANISEMNTEEIVQLAKDIKSIRETGKTVLEAKEELRQMKLAEIREALARSIIKHSVHKKALEKEVIEKPTPAERGKGLKQKIFEGLNKATAELKQPHFITHMLDGYQALGPTYKYLTYPTDKASQNEEEIKVRVDERIKNILAPLGPRASGFLSEEKTIHGRKFTREHMWAVYANSKNPSNRATLTEDWGYGFSEEMVNDIVAELSPRERNMVDRIMKEVVEELYPETIRVTREYCGITPATVEDYWMIISDRELKDKALMRDIEKDMLADVFKKTNMDLDSVKDRVGYSGAPGLSFFRVLKKHTDSVIHFNTHALAVRDVQEMLFDPQVKAAVTNSVGEGGYGALKSSLSDIANPRHTPRGWFEVKAGQLRRNTTAVMLGLKVSVSLLQSGSIFQTIYRTGLKNTMWGIKTYWKNPRAADRFIYEHSLEQKNRGQHFDRELANLVDSNVDFVKRLTQGLPGSKNLLFQFIHAVDHITTMPSWLAGMKKAERENKSDPFTYANDIVQKTQPMGRIKNYSAIMRGNEFQRLFTMFYTFFSSAYNNMADASGKLRYRVDTAEGSKIQETTMAFGEFSRAYLWLLIMPALYAAMTRRPRKMKDKEYLLKAIASYALGTIPFVRDIGNAIINPQFDVSASPAFGAYKSVKMLATGKKPATKVKAGVMLGGYATGFPSSQAIITVSGAIDLMEGNTDNPLRLFLSEWTVEDKEKAKGAKLLTLKELRKTYKSKSIEQLRKEMMSEMR